MFRKGYAWVSKKLSSKKVKLFCDSIILVAASYLMLKKALGFSISGWLLNNVLHQSGVNVYVSLSASLLIITVVLKIAILITETFPPLKQNAVEAEQISECLTIVNREVFRHIEKCNGTEAVDINQMTEQHAFDVNIRFIVSALAEHIKTSSGTIKVKNKDLFISLYTYNKLENALVYECHFDHKRDLIKSKKLKLDDEQYKNYESVKSFNTGNNSAYVLDKKHYAKSKNLKRNKSITHFIGTKLETNGYEFGYLNVEFHNNSIFTDEEQMQDFMEESILPFKLMLEYQYLKKDFFHKFNNFNDYWRVA